MAAMSLFESSKQKLQNSDDKASSDLVSLAGDKYVLVKASSVAKSVQDGKANGKAMVGAPAVERPLKALMAGARSKGQRVGLKPLRLRMPYSFLLSCASGGIISSAQAIAADANTAEWAGLLVLYDEYRVLGGVVKYQTTYQTPAGANTIDALFCCLAYDPVDGSAPAGVRQLCEQSQHHLLCGQATSTVANSVNISCTFGAATGKPHQLRFRTPPVASLALTSSGTVNSAAGQWKKMNNATTNIGDGWLKFYGTSDNANVVTCITGIVYLDVEFRSRT
jgi:hypothetical protein